MIRTQGTSYGKRICLRARREFQRCTKLADGNISHCARRLRTPTSISIRANRPCLRLHARIWYLPFREGEVGWQIAYADMALPHALKSLKSGGECTIGIFGS